MPARICRVSRKEKELEEKCWFIRILGGFLIPRSLSLLDSNGTWKAFDNIDSLSTHHSYQIRVNNYEATDTRLGISLESGTLMIELEKLKLKKDHDFPVGNGKGGQKLEHLTLAQSPLTEVSLVLSNCFISTSSTILFAGNGPTKPQSSNQKSGFANQHWLKEFPLSSPPQFSSSSTTISHMNYCNSFLTSISASSLAPLSAPHTEANRIFEGSCPALKHEFDVITALHRTFQWLPKILRLWPASFFCYYPNYHFKSRVTPNFYPLYVPFSSIPSLMKSLSWMPLFSFSLALSLPHPSYMPTQWHEHTHSHICRFFILEGLKLCKCSYEKPVLVPAILTIRFGIFSLCLCSILWFSPLNPLSDYVQNVSCQVLLYLCMVWVSSAPGLIPGSFLYVKNETHKLVL